MKDKNVIIGADHAGFVAKQSAIQWFESKGYKVVDEGTYSEESTDYPDYAHKVASKVDGSNHLGVLICGSANGVAMAANKHAAIRAAICWNKETASLARTHNDANICCLPSRFINKEEMFDILEAFFSGEFEGGRHTRRVEKIACA